MTLAGELESLLPAGTSLVFGQLRLCRRDDGSFEACHLDDAEKRESLEPIPSAPALRELAKFDAAGEYRPLKTAPTLRGGWITRCDEAAEFLRRLDAIYPGVFATWIAYAAGRHHPTSLRRTLDRQTGMYRRAGTITDGMARRLIRELCHIGCLRTITWPIHDDDPVARATASPGTLPMICTEACTLAVNAARTLAKEARAAGD
ncbi:MAG: hypothetical protein GXX91_05040 [Verrucomicrobiaceae bacterium]|nr:hypothetical protein [Verrucomicrobiaceae bacterium]